MRHSGLRAQGSVCIYGDFGGVGVSSRKQTSQKNQRESEREGENISAVQLWTGRTPGRRNQNQIQRTFQTLKFKI